MIDTECLHEWETHSQATQKGGGNATPTFYKCKKCLAGMTASEVFQLEALENQNKTLRHLKGFQSLISVIAILISVAALIISARCNS